MSTFEYPSEKERLERFTTLFNEMANLTAEIEANFNNTGVASKFEEFMDEISPYLSGKDSVPDASDPFWNLEGSAFFCWTIMTTIGYGDYAPKTDQGKIFVIIYTILTVPLFVASLAHLSTSLTEALGKCFRKNHDRFGKQGYYFAGGVVALGLLFILVLPISFSVGSYLDTIYFSIVTLSTVGLGDFTPSLDDKSSFGFILYSLFGLLLIGSIVSGLQNMYDVGAQFVIEKAHSGLLSFQHGRALSRQSSLSSSKSIDARANVSTGWVWKKAGTPEASIYGNGVEEEGKQW